MDDFYNIPGSYQTVLPTETTQMQPRAAGETSYAPSCSTFMGLAIVAMSCIYAPGVPVLADAWGIEQEFAPSDDFEPDHRVYNLTEQEMAKFHAAVEASDPSQLVDLFSEV